MAQQQGIVTINGNLGADPVMYGNDPNQRACSFRVGVTPGYFDQSTQSWKNRETMWIAVRAFRKLGMNVYQSLHKGNPVIVTGTLRTERWVKDGVDRITPVIEATAVGHDLNQGTTIFRRVVNEANPNARQQGEPSIVSQGMPAMQGDQMMQNGMSTMQNGMATDSSYSQIGVDPFAQSAPQGPVAGVDLGVNETAEPAETMPAEATGAPSAQGFAEQEQHTDGFAAPPEHDDGEAEF